MEIRWRNSSIDNYKFWRIYTGLRYSRLIQSKYIYEDVALSNEIDELLNEIGIKVTSLESDEAKALKIENKKGVLVTNVDSWVPSD